MMTCKLMHHICYSFYWSIKKWSKLDSKKMGFFVYALFHPMSYPPKFCQMKDLIKIHICGKIYQYSICCCEIKIFQSLSYCFKINEMAPFGIVLGPYSPKYCSIFLKFSPEVASNKINTVWKIYLKNPHDKNCV